MNIAMSAESVENQYELGFADRQVERQTSPNYSTIHFV